MWWIQCMPCMSLSIVYRKAIDQRAAAPPGTGQPARAGHPRAAPGAESDHRVRRDPARRRPRRPAPRARRPDARARPAGAGRGRPGPRPGASVRRVIDNPRTSYPVPRSFCTNLHVLLLAFNIAHPAARSGWPRLKFSIIFVHRTPRAAHWARPAAGCAAAAGGRGTAYRGTVQPARVHARTPATPPCVDLTCNDWTRAKRSGSRGHARVSCTPLRQLGFGSRRSRWRSPRASAIDVRNADDTSIVVRVTP
jgi:hypothetical protein